MNEDLKIKGVWYNSDIDMLILIVQTAEFVDIESNLAIPDWEAGAIAIAGPAALGFRYIGEID